VESGIAMGNLRGKGRGVRKKRGKKICTWLCRERTEESGTAVGKLKGNGRRERESVCMA